MYSKLFHISKKRLFTHRQKQNKNIIKVPKGTKKKKKKNTLIKKAKVMSPFYTLTGPTLLALLISLPVNPINRLLLLCTLTLSSRS